MDDDWRCKNNIKLRRRSHDDCDKPRRCRSACVCSLQDGVVHASLEPAQILYLTIAYDWFLFG